MTSLILFFSIKKKYLLICLFISADSVFKAAVSDKILI